jgi:hypothetical protein
MDCLGYVARRHLSFKIQAVDQDVSEVLDESYTPSTPDDIALFNKKQNFIYAVLKSKVLNDRGKAIIRDHEHDFMIHRKLTAKSKPTN